MPDVVEYMWLFSALLLTFHPGDTRVCKTVDARNSVEALEQLRGCTVVEGSVLIVLMEKATLKEAEFEPYTFPELREVTHYMLFYRVQGLRSLGKLFPNLERIRGAELFQDFALVVFEMFSLREIGLASLREISRGSVNINKNPSLCFVDTVKWGKIARWDVVRNYAGNNMDAANCPGCPKHCRGGCWNSQTCQIESKGPAQGCHPLCVGGCSHPGPQGCYVCKGFFDLEGNCIQTCPPGTFEYLNWRCVTQHECTSTKGSYVIYDNKCLETCPSGYEPDTERRNCQPCREGRCLKWCNGAVINSTGEAQRLRGCTHINGSIEITIKSETSGAVHSVLEENLGAIELITGYLKVTRSSVVDLNFFSNLTMVRGNDTSKKNFALIIFNNDNLQELWDWDIKKNLTVTNGRLYFHYNPKLCLHHIYKLLSVIGYKNVVSNFEIGKESNGDKFPCNALSIDIKVKHKTHDRIEVLVPYLDNILVLRYVVFYTKDPFENITMFDDLDQCSDNGWKTKDISVMDSDEPDYKREGFRVNLTDLEPFTTYVFYVTTYTIYNVGARSGMHRESTLPTTPSEVTRLRAFANSSSEIQLQWEPPEHINGMLEKYVVTWYELEDDRNFIDQRNYCLNPMVTEIDAGESKKKLPRIQVKNDSCCSKQKYLPKDGFEMLCDNFVNVQFPLGFPGKTKFSSCESYFYSYIFNSESYPSPDTYIRSNYEFRETVDGKKFGRNKSKSPHQNDIFADDSVVKNRIQVQVLDLPANSKSYVLSGKIKNFRNYVIDVKACRERDKHESEKSANNRCSRSEIVTVRTKGNYKFDSIPHHTVSHDVKKGTLRVKWKPPEFPNGLVVAFKIEYRHRDLVNPKHRVQCITHSEYIKNNNQHRIDGLGSGKYEFRIRSVSLFGQGPFTSFISFDVETRRSTTALEIFCVALVVLIVLILVFASSYFRKPFMYGVVVADVNPNYHYIPDRFEINRDDVEFGHEIGLGSFGKVYEGRLKSKDLRCAIKTVNDNATVDNENEFLIEASVMKSMTNAYFVVELFGVVSRSRPPLVLMELMELGDLKSYLRKIRDVSPISNATMIRMALEIADGMSYLEAQRFVHRDLAARNCMVTAELTVKVGDFGMARDIYETDYYRKATTGFLPIRWMAPESLKDGEFTVQSDIWSYGVVLWEIATMGQQPYQGSSNDQVLREVMDGRKLEIPKLSPLPLKNLMAMCWRTKPAKRSSFMNIVGIMEYYHDVEFIRVAFYHSLEAVTARREMWEYVEMQPVTGPSVSRARPSYRLATVDEENSG